MHASTPRASSRQGTTAVIPGSRGGASTSSRNMARRVAKHGYVKMRGGWFSDRSVCYLASGRPFLVQDTGLADWLPVGEGVITFQDLPELLHGIEIINADYERHCRAARKLAEEVFSTEKVLPALLAAATS